MFEYIFAPILRVILWAGYKIALILGWVWEVTAPVLEVTLFAIIWTGGKLGLNQIWRKHITIPLHNWRCVDYQFAPNPTLDALCEEINQIIAQRMLLQRQSRAERQNLDKQLQDMQLQVQEKGGIELKEYLNFYFVLAARYKKGEWGTHGPQTLSEGWARFRTANNWVETANEEKA